MQIGHCKEIASWCFKYLPFVRAKYLIWFVWGHMCSELSQELNLTLSLNSAWILPNIGYLVSQNSSGNLCFQSWVIQNCLYTSVMFKEQSLNAYLKCQIIMIVLESHLDMSPCYTPLTQHLIQVPIFHNLTHQIWALGYHTGVSVAEHLPHMSLNIHQNLTRGHRHHQLYNVHIIYL